MCPVLHPTELLLNNLYCDVFEKQFLNPDPLQPFCRLALENVFDEVFTVDLMDSKDQVHLSVLGRPELGVTYTKIHCWTLTQYSKCVFLDADTLVRTQTHIRTTSANCTLSSSTLFWIKFLHLLHYQKIFKCRQMYKTTKYLSKKKMRHTMV